MSDLVQKLTLERDSLRQELEHRQKASNVDDACESLVNEMATKADPMVTQPNEWAGQDNGGGCCTIV